MQFTTDKQRNIIELFDGEFDDCTERKLDIQKAPGADSLSMQTGVERESHLIEVASD